MSSVHSPRRKRLSWHFTTKADTMPVKIIITSSFDRDYQKLPQELQRAADKQIELLSADLAHPSLRSFLFSFHKHPTILFLRSLVNPRRISLYQTKKRLRAIVHFVFATKCAKPPSTPSYPLHFAHTGYKFRPVNAPRITRHPVGCQKISQIRILKKSCNAINLGIRNVHRAPSHLS